MHYHIYKSRWKAVWLLLGSAIFVAVGIFLLAVKDDSVVLAWSCIGFFGLGVGIGAFQLFDRRPQITLSVDGLLDRLSIKELLPWEVIHDVYVMSMSGQTFISLAVDPAFVPSRRKGKLYQAAAALNKAVGFQEYNIMLAGARVRPERLATFIAAMCQTDAAGREAILRKELAEG